MGQSFHATEVGPFDTEPPGTCTVVFDTLTLGVVDGEIDCTLTAPAGDASVDWPARSRPSDHAPRELHTGYVSCILRMHRGARA